MGTGGFFAVRLQRKVFPGDDDDILKEFKVRAAAEVETVATGTGGETVAMGTGGETVTYVPYVSVE